MCFFNSIPPNLKFVVDDFEDEWVDVAKYDFIHARYLAGSVRDFARLTKQAYKLRIPSPTNEELEA